MTELDEFMKAIKERLPEGMRELKRPYRARLYCPREYVELANRGLNAAWGDSGDNLSREMSPTGRRPWTHKAGNYAAIPPAELRSLLEVFSRCPGSCCVVTPTEVDEIIGIFGIERKSIIGQVESFETTAEKLFGIRFSDVYYWELDEINSELILQAVIIPKDSTAEGVLVRSIPDAWMEIAAAIDRNPGLLFDFTNDPRRFEEFLAATYERAGYEVVLTPRSSDRGRDVIASKRGFGAIRILDQAKAYSKGHRVSHNDVRAMLGVLAADQNASKGVITTTSTFQPRILENPDFKQFMPFRLQLVDGSELRSWIKQLSDNL